MAKKKRKVRAQKPTASDTEQQPQAPEATDTYLRQEDFSRTRWIALTAITLVGTIFAVLCGMSLLNGHNMLSVLPGFSALGSDVGVLWVCMCILLFNFLPVAWWQLLSMIAVARGYCVKKSTMEQAVFFLIIGQIILIRPWIDGATYPQANAGFVCSVVVLTALWGARQLMRGSRLHNVGLVVALGAVLGIAYLTTFASIRVDQSQRQLLMWACYFFLFVLSSNAIRSRGVIGGLVALLVGVAFYEAIYSILQLEYVLPAIRAELGVNPALLVHEFKSDVLTPDLRDRLLVNRAFGSFLFPNALAAYLVLVIPVAIAGVANLLGRLRAPSAEPETDPVGTTARLFRSLASAAIIWMIALFTTFGICLFITWHLPPNQPLPQSTWTLWAGVVPLLFATGAFELTRRTGWGRSWNWMALIGAAACSLLLLYDLFLSFSRGGMLALLVATAWVALLWFMRTRGISQGAFGKLATAVSLVLVSALALSAGAPGWAQDAPAAVSTPGPQLDVAGYDPTFEQFANPATMGLRLGYWGVAWDMVKDRFFTGVGLGNFSTAYPNYQHPDATPVQAVHNDFLQMFAETGVFGFLAFASFWLYFAWVGARHLMTMESARDRWLLGGLYAGSLAFAFHAIVDFNFQNPGLAMIAFIVAGLTCAWANASRKSQTSDAKGHQMLAIPVLLVVALVAGGALNMARAEAELGGRAELSKQVGVAQFFLEGINPATYDPNRPKSQAMMSLIQLIPSQSAIERFAEFRVPTPDRKALRLLNPGENIVPHIQRGAVAVVKDPVAAREVAWEYIDKRLASLERADALYPRDPTVAVHLFSWYHYLADHARSPEEQHGNVVRAVEWAEKCVERSPEQSFCREYLGTALWKRAVVEKDPGRQMQYYDDALDQFRKAAVLYPISHDMRYKLAEHLYAFGRAVRDAGSPDRGERYLAEGKQVLEEARRLHREAGAIPPSQHKKNANVTN
jgi:O-antigen ligase